jgi:hypothetical protein
MVLLLDPGKKQKQKTNKSKGVTISRQILSETSQCALAA